jgi:DNA-binding MarR family transcriptional regulator
MKRHARRLTDRDYRHLLQFRDGLRRFQHWSEQQAQGVGLTGAQHQLLLAVRGHGAAPSVRDLADHLLLRHHSVVELVDRAERAGLVTRSPDPDDHRVVRIALTGDAEEKLASLSGAHIEELARLRATFESLGDALPEG